MTTYKVVRIYQTGRDRKTIKTGLTLEEAQAHCSDPETSSSTCSEATIATEDWGPWFDAYYEE